MAKQNIDNDELFSQIKQTLGGINPNAQIDQGPKISAAPGQQFEQEPSYEQKLAKQDEGLETPLIAPDELLIGGLVSGAGRAAARAIGGEILGSEAGSVGVRKTLAQVAPELAKAVAETSISQMPKAIPGKFGQIIAPDVAEVASNVGIRKVPGVAPKIGQVTAPDIAAMKNTMLGSSEQAPLRGLAENTFKTLVENDPERMGTLRTLLGKTEDTVKSSVENYTAKTGKTIPDSIVEQMIQSKKSRLIEEHLPEFNEIKRAVAQKVKLKTMGALPPDVQPIVKSE